ncbi:hypothetical protein DOM21_11225 [Bacteriovorax stolpii]|uniref:C1 family peptidase n=1 Tax=Bacteriovorax stolpii TaxID=960 RepID=UPI001157B322|nr:C1 family peptidase [Bacteriovorax stolpii]QDK42007.1 hypothetical protein DOM21_11225 [Bacteriovorax stolpii]
MANLRETTRVLVCILCTFIVVLSKAGADVCEDAVLEFQVASEPYTSKRLMAYDDVKAFSGIYSQFKSQIAGQECSSNAIVETNDIRQSVKEKRIETVQKYMKLGIKEEGGKDLSSEYDYLTGKSKKYKYDFEDVFNQPAGKVVVNNKVYEDIVVPPKKNESVVKPAISGGKCADKINQNEAVNLDNVRNQDTVGWCYAYTAADLLSYRLKKRISAVSLYNSGQEIEQDIKTRESANGGDIKRSIDNYLTKKNGLCLEDDLPSNDFKFCTDSNYSDFLNNLLSSAREKRIEQDLTSNCFGNDIKKAFPGVDVNFIRNHTNRFGAKKLVEALYDNQCKELSFKGYRAEVISQFTSRYPVDTLMKTINDQISNGEIIGVGYDYNKVNGEEGTGDHGSIVVGRRTNPETGACEYLLRNSWGKNCEQNEGEGLSCHKNCDSNGCRYSGHFWVSESKLKQSISGVTYLK